MGELTRFLTSPYWLANFALIGSYVWARNSFIDDEWEPQKSATPLHSIVKWLPFNTESFEGHGQMEWTALCTCLISATWRGYQRCGSFDARMSSFLRHAQLFVLMMTFMAHTKTFLTYALIFCLIFLAFDQPMHSGSSKVTYMTPAAFKERCQEGGSELEPGTLHLVYVYASWHTPSREGYTTVAGLSNRYASDKVKFSRLDLGEWPRACRLFNVDPDAGLASQLPLLIGFEGGKEVMRLPRGKVRMGQRPVLHSRDAVRCFELDMRLATAGASGTAAVAKKTVKGSGAASKKDH